MNLSAKILAHNRQRQRQKHHPFYQSKLVRSLRDKTEVLARVIEETKEKKDEEVASMAKGLAAMQKLIAAKENELKSLHDRFTHVCDQDLFNNVEMDRQNDVIVSQRAIIAQQLATINSMQDKLVSRGQSHLLNLPVELLQLVIDQVPPNDCFFLSQTCQTLRALTLDRWAGNAIKYRDGNKKFSFILAVALRLDDAWACIFCEKIHFADPRYVPGTKCYFHKACHLSWAVRYHKFSLEDKLHYEKENIWTEIEHREVQMALKYTLRGEKLKAAQFLKPYCHSGPAEPFMHKFSSGMIHFSLQPKVCNGRYIAYAEYTFQTLQNRLISTADFVKPIWISTCIHEWHKNTNDQDAFPPADETYLVEKLGIERTTSCSKCASDFAYMSQGDQYQIRTWRYLGQYERDIYIFSAQTDMKRPIGYKILVVMFREASGRRGRMRLDGSHDGGS